MVKVQVLMAAYNGMKYIHEQLQSIYEQEEVLVDLLVRDDASTDETPSLLAQEQEAGRLRWYTGKNLGPARSFMDLIKHASGADLYAFSDHDDVWMTDKLKSAADCIANENGPALYFCQTRLVDENLHEMPQVPIHPRLTYGESLVYQFVGGCTMVMNDALLRIVNQYDPVYLRMHDIWVYDIALAIGAKVVFDPVPHINYRQHGGNAVGQSASCARQWRERSQRLKMNEHIRLRTAQELLLGYAEQMTPENRKLTELLVRTPRSLKAKFQAIFCSSLWPARRMIGLTSRLAILTNNF